MSKHPSPATLTRAQEWALTLCVAVVTANAYYIHPIIGEVARDFEISEARIGIVPALNQLALALGILLLLPLGDIYSNRRLCIIFVSGQTFCMLGMALADGLALFTLASTLLGFVTIAPYLIPAFASKRVAPARLGQVTALLTAGVLFGILVARVGAGLVAEYADWRIIYWAAFALMVMVTLALPLVMKSELATSKQHGGSYARLIASVFHLAREHRDMRISALIQGLNFASFTATWLALALHLTSDAMGYGTDVVGYLAGIAAISIFSTPRLGRWADKIGARRARLIVSVVQIAGVSLLYPLGFHVLTLLVPLLIINMVGPSIDVTGRMTFLALAPEIRTRLTTFYVVAMFIGGAIGSVAGTATYDAGGWGGTCLLLLANALGILALSWHADRQFRAQEKW
ncbi:MFS transporter [Erythrobacter sp. T5W1-R]|uniref:MFS transporter n=1 Tax=Erythrobacter sp. T5W1-R TaxID=3101752 RepID=UPI002B00081C|nr:MFS transporter [Erythrobacter sp. T5W1-R]MEA1619536.1 MFS transporter [Erythrobacter sp. T5W1-R]